MGEKFNLGLAKDSEYATKIFTHSILNFNLTVN